MDGPATAGATLVPANCPAKVTLIAVSACETVTLASADVDVDGTGWDTEEADEVEDVVTF